MEPILLIAIIIIVIIIIVLIIYRKEKFWAGYQDTDNPDRQTGTLYNKEITVRGYKPYTGSHREWIYTESLPNKCGLKASDYFDLK